MQQYVSGDDISVPGQDRAGVRILGTSAESIDTAEDRHKFSALLDQLSIDQPPWQHVTQASDAERIVERLGGYPVLVRPSYVLSGAAMSVAREKNELLRILARAKAISPEHPVVVSKFETHARELEIDAVADGGEIVLWAISEHVEDAGVHSCDATLVLPPTVALHRDHTPSAQDRPRAGQGAAHHRPLQRAVLSQTQYGEGHRVQPARVAQLPLRLQGHGQ
jgi:carbamoylphosphate synthase large subunit